MWAVVDAAGAGWGRYASHAEAVIRRDSLLAMRGGEGGFAIAQVLP